jgi:hypothetical protein
VNVTQGRTGDPTQADIPALSDRPRRPMTQSQACHQNIQATNPRV